MMPTARRRCSFSRQVAAIASFACALVALPLHAATDYTDLWWTPSESGWGVNLIQADDFIFSTFFVYGTTGQPTWFTGQLSRDANGNWTGPLYVTSGTFFGAGWNAVQSGIRQVGTASFFPASDASGTLNYNVDGVNVSKAIQRQTLKTIPLGGTYLGSVYSSVSGCGNPAENGVVSRYSSIAVSQTLTNNITLDFGLQNAGSCVLNGNANQFGQIYQMPTATYTCGAAGVTVLVTNLKATAQGVEGQWQGPIGGGCFETAFFTGTLQ